MKKIKIKNLFKINLKTIIIIIMTSLLVGGTTAFASYNYFAKDIEYKKIDGTKISVNDALNELYKKKAYIKSGLILEFDGCSNYKNSKDVIQKNNMSYFNGISSYVVFPRYQNDYITYEASFIPEDIQSDSRIISSTETGGLQLSILKGKLNFLIFINNEYQKLSCEINKNEKYHAVGTYDGNIICLYINGNLVNSKKIEGKMGYSYHSTITLIGAEPDGTQFEGYYYKGFIKNIRIYDRALNEDEIKNNYKSSL